MLPACTTAAAVVCLSVRRQHLCSLTACSLNMVLVAARQEVYGAHPPAGDRDLISSRPAGLAKQSFVDVSQAG